MTRRLRPSRSPAGAAAKRSSAREPAVSPDSRGLGLVTVVRALAHRGASVLMLRRAAGDSLGGCWELPGGTVRRVAGRTEAPLEALARELEEECGLRLCGTPRLMATVRRVSPTGKPIRELTYLAEVADGRARLSDEHDAAHWHPVHEPAPRGLTTAAADGLALVA